VAGKVSGTHRQYLDGDLRNTVLKTAHQGGGVACCFHHHLEILGETMTKEQVMDLLHISRSTLERRMADGTYKYTKAEGRLGKVSFTRADLGLPEPKEIPLPYQDPAPVRIGCQPRHFIMPTPQIEKKQQEDLAFASKYLAGAATDSFGNKVDGTNDARTTAGVGTLVQPDVKEFQPPADSQSHINPALLSSNDNAGNPIEKYHKDWHGGEPSEPQGFTDKGVALCSGLSQSDYDAMMQQYRRRCPKGRSESEFETKQRRDVRTVLESFPRGN